MTEREFLVMCKIKLDEAIKQNDGYNAHYYGKWLDHKEWLFMGRFLKEEFLNQNINTMENRTNNADPKSAIAIKQGTFVESMIKIQDLLKYSEDLYDKIYLIQRQIKSDVINKKGGAEVGCGSDLNDGIDLKNERNIFQRLTNIIDNVYRNLALMDEGLKSIYDTIGIRHDIEEAK
jgi:hypothetical protein